MGSRLTLNRDAAGLLGKAPLSTLFWFLSIGAYAYHSRKPGARRFTAVIALLVLSLSSKSVFVTAPLFFLLLDLWPLKRWNKTEGVAEIPQMDMGKLMIEKIPMVAIVVVISFVTIFARQEIGALSTADR